MGARSGSAGDLGSGAGNYQGSISGVESLKNIKDRGLYNATKQAISRYYKEMGLEQKKVKLADLPSGVGGVHVTAGGQSEGVYLSKSVFKNGTTKSVSEWASKAYDKRFLTKTNKPVAHILTHELAHSTWNEHMTGAKQKAAGKEIRKIYKAWKSDKGKRGYGAYAKANVSEFWSETVTKGIHGKADKYTKALKGIAKKYKL